jgi:hypothetical protein
VAQWQVQLGLRGRGRGEVHGGNVPSSLEDVGGRGLDHQEMIRVSESSYK